MFRKLLEKVPSRPHAIALDLVAILQRAMDGLAQGHQHRGKQGLAVVGEAVHQVGQRPRSLDPDSHGRGGEAMGDR